MKAVKDEIGFEEVDVAQWRARYANEDDPDVVVRECIWLEKLAPVYHGIYFFCFFLFLIFLPVNIEMRIPLSDLTHCSLHRYQVEDP